MLRPQLSRHSPSRSGPTRRRSRCGWAFTPGIRRWPEIATWVSRSRARPASARAAHGGQVLLSSSARALLSDHDRSNLRSLGAYRLKDFDEPEPISQLVIDGLPAQFPPLRTESAAPRRKRLLLVAIGVLLAAVVAAVLVVLKTGGGGVKVGPPRSPSSTRSRTRSWTRRPRLQVEPDRGWRGLRLGRRPEREHARQDRPSHAQDRQSFGIAVGAGAIPFGLAAGDGAVWVAVLRGTKEVVLEFGPSVGDLRQTIPLRRHRAITGPRTGSSRSPSEPVRSGRSIPLPAGSGASIRRSGKAHKLADGLDALSLAAGARRGLGGRLDRPS